MVKKYAKVQSTCGFIPKAIAFATAILLAVSLLAVGFAACMQPLAARVFAETFCNDGNSPYLEEDLASLAVETRNYTVSDYGRKSG